MGTHGSRSKLELILNSILLSALILLTLAIISTTTGIYPSFDGAMNLQVALNLSDGNGYARTYAEQLPFPREIQTNSIFIAAAAAIYHLFGMGVVQSQAANILFFIISIIATFFIGKSIREKNQDGFLTALSLILTPGLVEYGFSGYGELPSLAVALSGIAIYPWKNPESKYRIFLAAFAIGLSVTIKTVMLICAVSFGLAMALHTYNSYGKIKESISPLFILAAGYATPILIWEIYRLNALGDINSYVQWWSIESKAIGKQAGTVKGFEDTSNKIEKVITHLGLLSEFIKLNKATSIFWIAFPFISFVSLRKTKGSQRYIFAALLGASLIYFVWWLYITPTQKAWHRRIFDGMVLINLSLAVAAAISLMSNGRQVIAKSIPLVSLSLIAAIALNAKSPSIAGEKNSNRIKETVDFVKNLPGEAKLYGAGWASAPQIGLLTKRNLADINDEPRALIENEKPIYLIVDKESGLTGNIRQILSMYPHKKMLAGDSLPQVYSINLSEVSPGIPPLRQGGDINFGEIENEYFRGFYKPEHGGRWLSSDGAISMNFNGGTKMQIKTYAPGPSKYYNSKLPEVKITMGDCIAGEIPIKKGEHVSEIDFSHCAIDNSKPTIVRFMANSVIESAITKDDRSMSAIFKSLTIN